MEFTLDEIELMLRSLKATIAALTIFNEDTEALEKLMELFAVEKSRMMREVDY